MLLQCTDAPVFEPGAEKRGRLLHLRARLFFRMLEAAGLSCLHSHFISGLKTEVFEQITEKYNWVRGIREYGLMLNRQ